MNATHQERLRGTSYRKTPGHYLEVYEMEEVSRTASTTSTFGEAAVDQGSKKTCRSYPERSRSGDMLNDVAAAELLGVSPATLRSWRCRGTGPVYAKYGLGARAAVRYHRQDLNRFIDQSRQGRSVREA